MEPPARPARPSRRVPAAGRLSLAPLPASALLLLPVLLLSAGACGPGSTSRESSGAAAAGSVVADAVPVPPGTESPFEDLPGIDGFDRLNPEQQARVVERANSTRCDCGCPDHSVNHCLHQREACEVAIRIAGAFVDDALALQLQTGGAEPPPGEPGDDNPEPETASTDEPESGGDGAAN